MKHLKIIIPIDVVDKAEKKHITIDSIKFKGVSGVYKITIGECFYIGISCDIHKRMGMHSRAINRYLNNPLIIPTGSYRNIMDYVANKLNAEITVEVIKECKHTHRSYERRYLKRYNRYLNCFNNHCNYEFRNRLRN